MKLLLGILSCLLVFFQGVRTQLPGGFPWYTLMCFYNFWPWGTLCVVAVYCARVSTSLSGVNEMYKVLIAWIEPHNFGTLVV